MDLFWICECRLSGTSTRVTKILNPRAASNGRVNVKSASDMSTSDCKMPSRSRNIHQYHSKLWRKNSEFQFEHIQRENKPKCPWGTSWIFSYSAAQPGSWERGTRALKGQRRQRNSVQHHSQQEGGRCSGDALTKLSWPLHYDRF